MTKNDKKISKNQKTSISRYKTQKNDDLRQKIQALEQDYIKLDAPLNTNFIPN